jgi:putative flippase GtrA
VGTDQHTTRTAGRLATVPLRLTRRLPADDPRMQFVRFVAAGAVANLLYGALFLLLSPFGSQVANAAGALASSALANELHRRLTFRAGARVTWLRAQWEGGGLAIAGTIATSITLARFDSLVTDPGAAAHLVVVGVVTGLVGLIRFAALRWVFTANRHGGQPAMSKVTSTGGRVLVAASA